MICLNMLEGINQFYLLMWFNKTRLETPFKHILFDKLFTCVQTRAYIQSIKEFIKWDSERSLDDLFKFVSQHI